MYTIVFKLECDENVNIVLNNKNIGSLNAPGELSSVIDTDIAEIEIYQTILTKTKEYVSFELFKFFSNTSPSIPVYIPLPKIKMKLKLNEDTRIHFSYYSYEPIVEVTGATIIEKNFEKEQS